MRNYKITEKTLDRVYRGCGEAFARIKNNLVVNLVYVDGLVDYDDWANVADDEQPYLETIGEVKLAEFAEKNPDLVRGMVSGTEFYAVERAEK